MVENKYVDEGVGHLKSNLIFRTIFIKIYHCGWQLHAHFLVTYEVRPVSSKDHVLICANPDFQIFHRPCLPAFCRVAISIKMGNYKKFIAILGLILD